MSIDFDSETLLSLAEAAKTITRWQNRGIKGIRLECIRVGGRKFTSAEAIARFIDATNAVEGVRPNSGDTSSRQRQIARTRAKRQLERAGIRKSPK